MTSELQKLLRSREKEKVHAAKQKLAIKHMID